MHQRKIGNVLVLFGLVVPAPTVLGTQETQGATIPSTGSNTGDYLLLAGLALVLGGLVVRFGQADGTTA